MPKIVKPFSIAEAAVLTLDTSAAQIAAFDANDNIVRVPVRLEISKAAGTAYEVTYNSPAYITAATTPITDLFGDPTKAYTSEGIGGGAYLVVRDDYSRTFFWVPADALLVSAGITNFVAFPSLNGIALRPGRNTFSIFSNVGIATGTGAITGRIYFDEYPVVTA